jgi:hypothetical protein
MRSMTDEVLEVARVRLNLASPKSYHQTLIRLLRNHLLPNGRRDFFLAFLIWTARLLPRS